MWLYIQKKKLLLITIFNRFTADFFKIVICYGVMFLEETEKQISMHPIYHLNYLEKNIFYKVYQTKSNNWVVIGTWSESQKSDSFVFTENSVSGKYTAKATGIYYLSANVIFKDSNGPIYIMIAVNNQLSKRTALYATKGKLSVVQDSLSVSGALFTKKDSYVNVYVMIENDNSWSIDIDSTFSMVFRGYQTNIYGVTTVLTNSLTYTTSGWFEIGKLKSQIAAGPFFDFWGGFNPDTVE
nr:uncharacterized protein LOC124810430 [Hydra vulgaris]